MKTQGNIASRFAHAVLARPHMQHATVRLGLWLVAVAEKQGKNEIELFLSNIQKDYVVGSEVVPPVAFRWATVRSGVESLVDEGLISMRDGSLQSTRSKSKIITIMPGL